MIRETQGQVKKESFLNITVSILMKVHNEISRHNYVEALEPVYSRVGISTYLRLSATLFVLLNVDFHSNLWIYMQLWNITTEN